MAKSLLLAFSNVRKAKGQTVTLLIVLLLAAMIMQLGLILTMDYLQNFDRRAQLTNSEDVTFSFQTRDAQKIEEWERIIGADGRTQELETTLSLCHTMSYVYGGGEMYTHVVIFPVDETRTLGQFRFVDRSATETDDTIYLPYLMQTGGGYKTDGEFLLKIGESQYRYRIGGFYENTMIGSFNGGISSFLLSPAAYDILDGETGIQGVLFSIKLKNRADNESYYGDVGNRLFSSARNIVYNGTYYDLAKSSRTLTANVCASIFLGLALVVMAVALVITAYRISNSVEEDMRTYGALKAMGYTGGQIVRSVLLQFVVLTVVGCAVGIALSYALLPAVNGLLVMQTGLIWEYAFGVVPVLVVLTVMLATVLFTTFLATGKLRKLQPITALRQGVTTHSFKRNPVPLDRVRGNANLLLALKTSCQNLRQNAAMFLITLAVSLACVFMSVMLQSFVIEPSAVMGFLAGEQADAAVYTSAADADEVFASLGARNDVQRIYRYQTVTALAGGEQTHLYLVDDAANLNNPDICYEGRLPLHDNEVALSGKMAKAQGLKVGDMAMLEQSDRSAQYLITGLIQCSNFLGKDALMLNSGFDRIKTEPLNGGFYLLLKEGTDINGFLASVQTEYGAKIVTSVNVRTVIDGALGIYTSIVSILVAVFTALVIAIIALVLYLMVKTFLIRRKRDYGVLKALGYTTGQLVVQTAVGFMPVILLATVLGLGVGVAIINPLLSVLFGSIGIMKATFPIPPLPVVGFGLLIAGCSFGIAALVSLRVRRITPRALIAGE